ncbi:DUF421 domain-containing protein [Paracoccus sp. S-4012]|uniref:DUF421 domain-containing protein n=1 Tax=Paracoccus sp. S-4012 TaxID=2665648 RepID=UPI001E28663F|nr:YetF domain-containing protein [Paracoccus sp. S-4012]
MEPGFVPFDLQRMFLGDYPPLFYAEIAFRVVVIYGYTLLLIRWIGGRGVAQLSMVEFLLVIALGSAVGDAMFYDDVPLLVAMMVITVVVLINKALDKAIVHSQTAEALIDGRPVRVVRDGELVREGMLRRDIGEDEIKAILRGAGVSNLGQVEDAFLEINGTASVFRFDKPRPGLAIVPPADVIPAEGSAETGRERDGLTCCTTCGHVAPAASALPDSDCANCGKGDWTAPSLPPVPETLSEI